MSLLTVRYSEVQTYIECQKRWDFQYRGWVMGQPLQPKSVDSILYNGTALGHALAAYHSGEDLDKSKQAAIDFTSERLTLLEKKGIEFDLEEESEHLANVIKCVDQHAEYAERLNLIETELEVDHEVNGVRFRGHLDGLHKAENGQLFIVEFKMRGRFYDLWDVYAMRQLRYYSYFLKSQGMDIAGLYYDETLNDFPSPMRITSKGMPDGRYTYRLDEYTRWCDEHGVEYDEKLYKRCAGKEYHKRHEIYFDEWDWQDIATELAEVSQRMLQEYGKHPTLVPNYPLRNTINSRCGGCPFKAICFNHDVELAKELYDPWINSNLQDADTETD